MSLGLWLLVTCLDWSTASWLVNIILMAYYKTAVSPVHWPTDQNLNFEKKMCHEKYVLMDMIDDIYAEHLG